MVLLKGAAVAKEMTQGPKEKVAGFKRKPCLMLVRASEDPSLMSYVAGAKKRMEKCDIRCEETVFPETVSNEEFQTKFRELNEDEGIDGILVLSPLPAQIDMEETVRALKPEKDMDGDTMGNRAALYEGRDCMKPCTPEGVMEILSFYGIDLEGKNAVIVGRSVRVGKPLLFMMLEKNATVTLCHSRTKNLQEICSSADILVATLGKARFIKKEFVKEGAVVIDVGINVLEDGTLTGDVDFDDVQEKVSAITPVPGGTGAVTTSVLAKHVVKAYEKKEQNGI